MREILFRAQVDSDLKPWVYGYYHFDKSLNKHYICDQDTLVRYEVIPETVGQYIGINDKNGTKIFEDDILKGAFGTGIGLKSTKYKDFFFRVSYHGGGHEFFIEMPANYGKYRFLPSLKDCEVVGTIHTHPELLTTVK